jgi:hypothetical protein
MSALCAIDTPKVAVDDRRDCDHVRKVRVAGLVRIIDDIGMARREPFAAITGDDAVDSLLIGNGVDLNAAADDQHAPVGVGQPGAAVAGLAQDRRIAAVIEHMLHRRRDFAQPVGDDFSGDGIERHHCVSVSTMSAP